MTTDPLSPPPDAPPGTPSSPSAPPSSFDNGGRDEGRDGVRAGPARVLVVDDEIDIREALEMTMRGAGYEVCSAENGAMAVEVARAERFDVVVTDYRMPGLDGAQTLRALKLLDPTMRVIVATGYGSPEQEAECRADGADDYVRKPFELRAILDAVGRLLK